MAESAAEFADEWCLLSACFAARPSTRATLLWRRDAPVVVIHVGEERVAEGVDLAAECGAVGDATQAGKL
jgi:hypothetical protein